MQELQLEDINNLLGHWMAYRIAELMDKIEKTVSETERENIKQECTDLILKVWEKRTGWTTSRPLGKTVNKLRELIERPRFPSANDLSPNSITWIELPDYLKALQEEQWAICSEVWIATLDLQKEEEWLNKFPEETSTDEGLLIVNLLNRRKAMDGEDYILGEKKLPKFGLLPHEEKRKIIISYLNELFDKSQKLLAAVSMDSFIEEKETMDTNDADSEQACS